MEDRGTCGCFERDFIVRQYRYWRLSVSRQQGFLGWCLIILQRHEADPADLKPDEVQELWKIAASVRDAISSIFEPDHFNYAFLGNVVKHVHMHIMPRYESSRSFFGEEYTDAHWGWFAIPDPKESREEILGEIRRLLLESMEASQ